MRFVHCCAVTAALALLVPSVVTAQDQDASRVVKDGGISVPGWQGKIDPQEVKAGQALNNAKLAPAANGALQVTTGPAVTYWNPKNVAAGNYTVKASFAESKNKADHPHAYGVFIGGSKLDTETPSLLYCIAYGNGTYLVRGFSGGQVLENQLRAE